MSNIIFLCVFLYGLGQMLFARSLNIETNLVWYTQTGAAILIGGGVSLWNVKGYLYSLMTRVKLPTKVVTNSVVAPESKIFVPTDYEERDFSSLVQLRSRCARAGSQEGLALCAQLAAVLFSLEAKIGENV